MDTIKNLIDQNITACKAYEKAASQAKHPHLVTVFKIQADIRRHFAQVLATCSENSMGQELAIDDAISNANINTDTDEIIIGDCLKEETAALKEYNNVLMINGIPLDAQKLITFQRNKIQNCITDLKLLENTIVYKKES